MLQFDKNNQPQILDRERNSSDGEKNLPIGQWIESEMCKKMTQYATDGNVE